MDQDSLRNVRLFKFLSDEERREFLEAAESVSFLPSEDIILEGRKPDSLYVLLSGVVEVRKRLSSGGERVLAEIVADKEQTIAGERGLLEESGASATVRARSRVEAIRIPRETFRRIISEDRPAAFKLAYWISRLLARRLTRLDEEVVEAVREMERQGDTDLDVFRDRLTTEWTV
ncbi:MAG: cyclic nucleotide-binding domain-containing protein [Actinomycetota bacterium]|nr:cyclic nucleotide-binding domain-containing protein [Actinomycetota bacterium]